MRTVVISQASEVDHRRDIYDKLDIRLNKFLTLCGFAAVPCPNSLIEFSLLGSWLDTVSPQAVILSGGGDIAVQDDRRLTEKFLIEYSLSKELPLLGICRGMQAIGHYYGSELKPVKNHVGKSHRISGTINRNVESFHDYSLRVCPPGFTVIARSDDEELEAISMDSNSTYGIMWHPERKLPFDEEDKQMIINWLSGNFND